MREIIALAFFVLLTACVILLCVKKQMGKGVTAVFLIFALVSGWSIANYDQFQKVEWRIPGIKHFEEQVSAIKQDAIAAIAKEADARRESLSSLAQEVAGPSEKLSTQKKTEETLAEASRKLGESLKAQERQMKEVQDLAERARDEMLAIHDATSELALTLTQLIYLQIALTPGPANERDAAARQQVLNGLDQVVTLAIPDPREREKFIADVKRSIPSSK